MASVASTYARAFADVVFERHLDATSRRWRTAPRSRGCCSESAELRRVWENPAVPADQKRKLLDAIVQRDGIEQHVRNLVAVLIDHRRLPVSGPRSSQQLEKELDARLGFAEAQITSARELGDAEKRALEAQIEKTTGKKVRATVWPGCSRCWAERGPRRQHDLRRFGEGPVGED